jgi:hypothetical protein
MKRMPVTVGNEAKAYEDHWLYISEIDHPTIQYGIPAYPIPKAEKI